MKSCTITLAWMAWLLTVLAAGGAVAQDPSPNDLAWLRNKCPGGEGALAYESAGTIHLTELSTGQTVQVGNGTHAEFSPDSSKLAWIDGSTAKGRMRLGSSTVHTIATGVTESSGIHWISNTEVVLVRSGQWQRVSIGTGQPVAEPGLSGMPTDWFEMDVKRDGSLWILAGNPGSDFNPEWKTSAGGSGSTDGHCSSSLAPEGRSMTALMGSHRECQLKRIRTGGADGSLDWVWDYTAPKGFDNHRWSSNDDRFIACQDEKYDYMVVMEVGGTYCTRMGQQGSGEMYGDFTVGDGSGDLWPGTEPVLQLSPQSLSFSAVEGGANPSQKTVSVSNSGGGTLNNVSASEDAGWLSVSRSGSGNSQTLANSVDISGLSAGSYSQTVTVSCSNASNSPRTYSVNLQVAEPVPVLALSPGSLSFASVAGGSDPSPQDVAVTNQGGGTLDSVSAAEDAGWLSVSRSGSGNSQTLTNSIDISGLANGTYNETVVVSCPNASNAPLSYTVTLMLSEELVLAGIQVVPAATTILAGDSVEVTAYPQDQYGDAFAADIAWLVSGGGFMAPISSGGAVTEHTSTFSSDGTQGNFTVTAESGGIQGSADITVESQPGLPIQINCGDNGLTPSGWSDDDLFVQGGEDFVFSDTFDTAGVQDAAPEEVYQTCRHRIRGVETSYGYDFPALPNEEYLVRLHFGDAYGPRSIDVWIEGALVIENMDIATEAGAQLRALVREFSVFVTDGDGLQIVLTDDRAEPADFFVNGIEILEPEIITDGGTEDGGTEDGGTEDGETEDGGTNDGEVHPDGDIVADKPADDGAAADQDASVAEGHEDEPAIQGSCSCSSPAGAPPIITLGLVCIVVFRRRSARSPKA